MKTTRTLLLLSIVAMLFSSCQKDSVTFRLRFKGFNHDAKVYIDDNRFPQWIPEVDAINVNGVEYPVSNSSQVNTVTVATSANYLAVYPNSVYQSISGNEAALLIPEHQLYRTAQVGNEAVQVVEAPMSAKVSSGNTLVFENAGALLAINVVNNYGQDPLMIDEITVSASDMALWGNASLDFSQSAPAYTITSQVEGHNAVTLSSINHVLETSGHKVFYIYVPATPSGVNNLFTISVSAHSSDHEGTFTRSQTTANAGNIARGDMAAFDFNLGADEVTKVWARSEYPNGTIRGGKFSIRGNGAKVFFSAGNLEYYCSTDAPQWRLAPSQTYICGADNVAPAEDTDKWIDLFGWGTSGSRTNSNPNYPYQTTTSGSYYMWYGDNQHPNTSLGSTPLDWGEHVWRNSLLSYNSLLAKHPNSSWRTLVGVEWLYLLNPNNDDNKRKINNVGGLGHTFSIVTVNGVLGLLIFHDGFLQGGPNSIQEVDLSNYSGCAFLPFSGYRDKANGVTNSPSNTYYQNTTESWYWTASSSTLQNYYSASALGVIFQNSENPVVQVTDQSRYKGFPVRLVCDVP